MFEVDLLLEECIAGKIPTESIILELLNKLIEVYVSYKNLIEVSGPAIIVGDIHGQLFDMLEIFKICGRPPVHQYIFLGDYVDRGSFSFQTICLLFCYKLKYPNFIHMIRGNHESRQLTQVYGFYDDCLRNFGNLNPWKKCMTLFDHLPLCVILNNSYICIHGGIGPEFNLLSTIKNLDRHKEIPNGGVVADIVWNDPSDDIQKFEPSPRGAGYIFGNVATLEFFKANKLETIFRSHQLCMSGYQFFFDAKVITIWSVPNYCYRSGNLGSVYNFKDEQTRELYVFGPAPKIDSLNIPEKTSNISTLNVTTPFFNSDMLDC